jgi:hypothetical protein
MIVKSATDVGGPPIPSTSPVTADSDHASGGLAGANHEEQPPTLFCGDEWWTPTYQPLFYFNDEGELVRLHHCEWCT